MGLMAATSAAHAQTADGRRAGNGAASEAAQIQRLREGRYQLGQMERVLEGQWSTAHRSFTRSTAKGGDARRHAAHRERFARGFRPDGYGVFFDVEVPDLGGTLTWSYLTLDQNALGLDSALQTLRSHVQANNDANLQQALKRVELQVSPASRLGSTPGPVSSAAVPAKPTLCRRSHRRGRRTIRCWPILTKRIAPKFATRSSMRCSSTVVGWPSRRASS